MDEYIKREEALKIIDNYSKACTVEGKVVAEAIKDIIAVITPTADVVPKSEVFLASSDAMKMLIECHGYALTHDADIKKEVAREFIEAVDSMIELVSAMIGLDIIVFGGKYAELKKKYTEGGKC